MFDSASQASFKTLRDGRLAFYPYFVGRGYVVSDEERKVLGRYLTRGLTVAMAFLAFASFFGAAAILFVALLYTPVYYGRLWWLTKGLERAPDDERLTLGERYRIQAQHTGWVTLWFLEVLSGLGVGAGLYILATHTDRYSTFVGLLCALFFGLGAWASGYMIWAKRDNAKKV